ncbi:MAG: ORF6N domain-containing protein [Marinobacterium sp.]|nr:ORF6N domain-containing protein [Marinobacterium sp.]
MENTPSTAATLNIPTPPRVEYNGQPVLTFAMIDEIHQRPNNTARKRFSENKLRFVEGEDFYLIDFSQKSVFRTFGINVPPRGLTVLTLTGYLMLVKSFQDDLAWQVQRHLVMNYFQSQQSAPTPLAPSEPPINTTGPHWMQLDGKPVITFKLIEQLTGHSVGQLTYLYHKNKDQFAESCWVLSTSQPGFQQLKDQGQGGNVVRLFSVEGYQLLMQLYQNEYQPRLEAEQAELLPAPEAASEQQLFQVQGVVPFCDLSGVDLPYPAARHEQPGSKVEDLGDERLETYIDVYDEAKRDQARYDGLQYKTICHYLLKGLATRDTRLQVAAMGTLFAMRRPLGLEKINGR